MSDAGPREGVLLIKGLSRFAFDILPLGWRLRAAGFETLAPAYDSRKETLETAARAARAAAPPGWDVVHAVGHSLGGLVASWMVARLPPPDGARWGRVVQMGAPNDGTAVAAMLARWPAARAFLGPTLDEMARPRPDLLAISGLPFIGAISADRGQTPQGAVAGMPAPNDGEVPVASALGEARHTFMAPTSHAFYPYSRAAAAAAAAFLRDGNFDAARHLEAGPRAA